MYELASVGDLPLPQSTQVSAKRERDSDSPVSLQSNASTSTINRVAVPAKAPTRRVSVSPPTSSLGTPYVDQLYSDAFAQAAPPADILPQPAQPAQSFAYAHLPTHSDELARVPVPGHVYQTSSADTSWLAPGPHTHRHQPHVASLYASTSYGTPPNTADAFTGYVAQVQQGGQDDGSGAGPSGGGGVNMWQTVPTGYEFVFPFPHNTGAAAGHGGVDVGGSAMTSGHFVAAAGGAAVWQQL